MVECILNDSDVQELHLNFTKGASRTEAEPLTEAVATLIDLTNDKTVGQFVKSEGDLWTLNYTAMHEHVYRIEIQVPGYGLIYAEETMPEPIDIFSETREWSVDYMNNPSMTDAYELISIGVNSPQTRKLKCNQYGAYRIRVDEYYGDIHTAYGQLIVIVMGS